MRYSAKTLRWMISQNPPLITWGEFATRAEEEAWEDRLLHIEGSVFDLTLAAVKIPRADRTSYIMAETRRLPIVDTLYCVNNQWHLSNGYYFLQSKETITCPVGSYGGVQSRRSFSTAAASMDCTGIPPGYSGRIVVGLRIDYPYALVLENGARFCGVYFGALDSEDCDPYDGIWGGEKVTSAGTERGY